MIRLAFAIGLLLISTLLVVLSLRAGYDTAAGELLLGLGTEVLGILITVAIVDWLLERRRLQDRARELAWSTLHALERAVWLWQGGPRRLESDELLGIISGINASHELQSFSRATLAALGGRSREALNREAAAVKALSGLKLALEELTTLDALSEERSSVSVPMVSEVLESATRSLAQVLGQSTQAIPAALVRYRDARPQAQTERYTNIRSAADSVERA